MTLPKLEWVGHHFTSSGYRSSPPHFTITGETMTAEKSAIKKSRIPNQKAVKRGRPETRTLAIDATPEYAAKAMFAAGKMDVGKSGGL